MSLYTFQVKPYTSPFTCIAVIDNMWSYVMSSFVSIDKRLVSHQGDIEMRFFEDADVGSDWLSLWLRLTSWKRGIRHWNLLCCPVSCRDRDVCVCVCVSVRSLARLCLDNTPAYLSLQIPCCPLLPSSSSTFSSTPSFFLLYLFIHTFLLPPLPFPSLIFLLVSFQTSQIAGYEWPTEKLGGWLSFTP